MGYFIYENAPCPTPSPSAPRFCAGRTPCSFAPCCAPFSSHTTTQNTHTQQFLDTMDVNSAEDALQQASDAASEGVKELRNRMEQLRRTPTKAIADSQRHRREQPAASNGALDSAVVSPSVTLPRASPTLLPPHSPSDLREKRAIDASAGRDRVDAGGGAGNTQLKQYYADEEMRQCSQAFADAYGEMQGDMLAAQVLRAPEDFQADGRPLVHRLLRASATLRVLQLALKNHETRSVDERILSATAALLEQTEKTAEGRQGKLVSLIGAEVAPLQQSLFYLNEVRFPLVVVCC